MESVLLSIPQTFVKIKNKEGEGFAIKLQKLKNSIDEPLIIILTLNTFAHTVGSILVGVQAKITYSSLGDNRTLSFFDIAIKEDLLVGIVSAVMTILILVLSEIIPKTLGARYWDKLAKPTSLLLYSIIPLFKYSGILSVLQFFTNLLGKSKTNSGLSREDFSTMAEIAEEEGVIEEMDSDFIKNIIKLKDVKAKDIMTPFSVMKTADENITINEFQLNNHELSFSRIPVYSNDPKKIKGYVLKDTILENIIKSKGELQLKNIKRPVITIKPETKIPFLFEKLLKIREHISLVTDKKNSVKGIVTLEDIIETMLGLEIVDETDTIEDLQLFAKENQKKIKNGEKKF